MTEVISKHVDEIEHYEGPQEIEGIRFKAAGKALGIAAWGMNVMELAPNTQGYPEHDHQADGQEELYTVLRGRATLEAGEQRVALEPGVLVRVGPSQTRKIVTGDSGATLLAIGATPGKVHPIPSS